MMFAPEAPKTPRAMEGRRSQTPPKRAPKPALLEALQSRSANRVRVVLQQDPKAAKEPFWDQCLDLPLCFAVRLRCSPTIVKLLLQHGADPDAEDSHGCSPIDIAWKPPPWETNNALPAVGSGLTFPHNGATITKEHAFAPWQEEGATSMQREGFSGFGMSLPRPQYKDACDKWRREVTDILNGAKARL